MTLILVVILLIILAGLFAGAETGMYRISRLRLQIGIEKRKLTFILLGKSLHDSSALLLSMLLGTNLAHYIAISIVTYILWNRLGDEHTAELLATFLMAPVLFIFSELLPKNIFFYRADSIMPRLSPLLFACHKLFSWSGIVPLLKRISGIFASVGGFSSPVEMTMTTVHPSHIDTIIQETHEEGFLSHIQADIINRLITVSKVGIKSVMTPLEKVQSVDVNSDRPALVKKLKESVFTRLPVYDRWLENIVGFINIYDCLSLSEQFTALNDFLVPIRKVHGETTIFDTIGIMQRENQKIILVTAGAQIGREKSVGIVTMKDLVEELLGELAEW
jgi:CBS domain containing-hemolysin-like protein